MRRLYEVSGLLLAAIALPFIPIGFLACVIRFGFELGYSYARKWERFGEQRGWESKEENEAFAKENNLSI